MNRYLKLPKLLGTYRGRSYSRYYVVLTQSGLDRDFWISRAAIEVVAESPSAACNLVKDEIAAKVNHPTEIECMGPKGGITSRFIGYDALIWAKMQAAQPDERQLEFSQTKT